MDSIQDVASTPHLIETTLNGDSQRTYIAGVDENRLTPEEKKVLAASRRYEERRNAEENARLLKEARNDFEKLRDIRWMPKKAIQILKRWTFRNGHD